MRKIFRQILHCFILVSKKQWLYSLGLLFILSAFLQAQTNTTSQEISYNNIDSHESLDSLVEAIIELNAHIHALQGHTLEKPENNTTGKPYDSLHQEDLLHQKEILLESLPLHIINNKKPLIFNTETNAIAYKQRELEFNEATVLHDDFLVLQSTIAMQTLQAQKIFFTTLNALRKHLDFFSQQAKAIEILSPSIASLKKLPDDFGIPDSLSKQQQKTLHTAKERYVNTLASYIEIISYLELKSAELLPQNTMINLTMQWILEDIANFIPINHSNLLAAKILVSLIIFFVLWVWRKVIAKLIMFLMDFIVHISQQDKTLHTEIQKGILKPISLFLLAWSINVSIGILYYPTLEPESITNWFVIFYIINIAWLFIAIIKSYGAAIINTIVQKSTDGFRKEIINLILKILYTIVCIIAILVILKRLGFNVSAIIASLGLGGLAVALAVKDMLANFFASVMLLLDNSFSQGDWIVAGNVEGTVVEVGLRRTTIRTFDNALIFVPNSEIANKAIINWSRRKAGRRMKMVVGVTYDAIPSKLKTCVEQIAQMLENHEGVAKGSDDSEILDEKDHKLLSMRKDIISINDYLGYKGSLYVSVDELADSSINIAIDCFTRSVSKAEFIRVKEDIIFRIMDIVSACGLSFAFPSQSVYVESFPPIHNG
ncbi:mechanosensitive ion channel family protein [Helicobacter aurati]|nr:mechanosensitive ion channel domain-containing protein [Helicobacter aurati]